MRQPELGTPDGEEAEQLLRNLPHDLGYYLPGTAIDSVKDTGLSSSVYVIARGRECGIIDTGLGRRTFNTLVSFLAGRRLTPRWVILTHHHHDHVGNGPWIRHHYSVPLMIHSADWPLAEQPLHLFDDGVMNSRYAGTIRDAFEQMNRSPGQYREYQREVSRDQYHPVSVDAAIQEGDSLELGDVSVQVIHTPGHSPGSISLHVPSHRAIFAGDLPLWLGPGRPYPLGNYDDWTASMERLGALDPEFIGWGHSRPTVGGRNCRRFLRNTVDRLATLGRMIREQLSAGPATTAQLFEATDVIPGAHREMGEHTIHAILSSMCDGGEVDLVREDGVLYWQLL